MLGETPVASGGRAMKTMMMAAATLLLAGTASAAAVGGGPAAEKEGPGLGLVARDASLPDLRQAPARPAPESREKVRHEGRRAGRETGLTRGGARAKLRRHGEDHDE
jgi:hypothetical protein